MEDEFIESMVLFMQEAGITTEAQFDEAIRTSIGRCGIGWEGTGATQVGWRRYRGETSQLS